MLDYIVVGCGLAGIAFCEQLIQHNKSFVVFNNQTQNASVVAAGLYNPVILKRFSQVWHAQEQIDILKPYYTQLEQKLGVQLDHKIPIYRKFFSVEEQNHWFVATDNYTISEFLSPSLVQNTFNSVNAAFGFGEVFQTGYVDTQLLLLAYKSYLKNCNWLHEIDFIHADLVICKSHFEYAGFQSKNIVFCEGFGNRLNPFFDYLPIDGTKGEILTIFAPHLKINKIINSSVYLVPIGADCYKVGATYNWDDKTNVPTDAGKNELLNNLSGLITSNFTIINHDAGVRPTVKDRRPLVGKHPNINNMYILNGLGTRGVMLAPEMALLLYEFIEHQIQLDSHINCNRFNTLHASNLGCN